MVFPPLFPCPLSSQMCSTGENILRSTVEGASLLCPVMLKCLQYAHKKSATCSKIQFWYTWHATLPTAILMARAAT